LTPANPVLESPKSSALLDNITPDKESPMKIEEIESLFALMTECRSGAISKIMAEEDCDYLTAAIKYDGSMAPTVTDREKFKMIGFDFPADFVPATDDEATLFNERVMAAYAMWGDRIVAYEHFSPRDLSSVLQKIMQDTVRLVPPTRDCTQYIDLANAKP
jgi:hypothetical protein